MTNEQPAEGTWRAKLLDQGHIGGMLITPDGRELNVYEALPLLNTQAEALRVAQAKGELADEVFARRGLHDYAAAELWEKHRVYCEWCGAMPVGRLPMADFPHDDDCILARYDALTTTKGETL